MRAACLLPALIAAARDAPLTPTDYQRLLRKGFDVRWAEFHADIAAYTADHPRTVAAHGFDHVRIRVDTDFSDEGWARHLDTVINDSLAAGLVPILAKKAENLKDAPANSKAQKQYAAWWGDAAQRYRGMTHRLAFDLIVEPARDLGKDVQTLNKVYAAACDAIREADTDRILFFAPGHIASPDYLNDLVIPGSAGAYAMVEWHDYAAGPNPDPSSKKYWTGNGTGAQRKLFTDVVDEAVAWSQKHGVPTWLGAWMSSNYNHGNNYTIIQQVKFSQFFCHTLAAAGVPWAINTFAIFFDINTNQPIDELLPVLEEIKKC